MTAGGVVHRAPCSRLRRRGGRRRSRARRRAPTGISAHDLVLAGDGITAPPAVYALHRAVLAATAPHVPEWQPDEVTVQRYAPGSSGISTHLDGRRHRYLVAILTLEGSATLRHCTDREGTTAQTWEADAGSLVLLRGPGLAGIPDGRPLHAVDGPRERRRTSLTLRATAPRDVTSRG